MYYQKPVCLLQHDLDLIPSNIGTEVEKTEIKTSAGIIVSFSEFNS